MDHQERAMSVGSLGEHHSAVSRVRVAASERPLLFVVIDTEEEFDWSAPYSRANTGVTAMKHIHRVQTILERYKVKPIYVIDYPVASQPAGFGPLQQIWGEGRCHIGAHLHPWVNPPYVEEVNRRNSFTCNLPADLQRAKLRALADCIAQRFERQPRIFKAGRYGIGEATVGLLDELDFEVDTSISPRMDFRAEGGPSFAAFDSTPFFLSDRVLELPCTIDYVGWAGALRPTLHRIAARPVPERFKAVGILARAGVVNRVMLSPEGNTFPEMRSLVKELFSTGLRTFTLSFHSPSVEPGHTPYVRTDTDLGVFLRCLEDFCDFFFGAFDGISGDPYEFRLAARGSQVECRA
jgi:hypothetical protein